MKILTSFIILSSVLVACSQEDEVAQNPITPFYSQAQLSFVGTDLKDRRFGHNVDLSQVDCQYDPDTTTLKMVAYTFEEKATQGLKIKEDHSTHRSSVSNCSEFKSPSIGYTSFAPLYFYG
jgi:hypothetical protein